MSFYYVNRTLCSVLEEMRKAHETRNYAYLLGLIEEVQTLANRMEAGLGDKKDLVKLSEERSKLKIEVRNLQKLKKILGGKDEDK